MVHSLSPTLSLDSVAHSPRWFLVEATDLSEMGSGQWFLKLEAQGLFLFTLSFKNK